MTMQLSLEKIIFPFTTLMIFSIALTPSIYQEVSAQEQILPAWIKNIAVWWGEDKITDEDFVTTFQYLVEKKIITIPVVNIEPECGLGLVLDELTNKCVIHDESDSDGIFIEAIEEQQKTVVSLIKTTTSWWGKGKIADQDFIDALQYLVENGVLTIEPKKQPLIQPQLKPKPEELVIWPKIDRIEKFSIQGHKNVDSYQLQFKLVDSRYVSLDAEGTLSIVLMDDRNRILYLDSFSVRKSHYVESFSAFDDSIEGDKIYSWEIKTSDIRPGFTPYGKAKLVFTDRYGLKFFSDLNGVAIPQFN